MGNSVFPTLAGLMWDYTRTPVWSTMEKKAVSGRAYRSANYSYPLYRVKLAFEVLRQYGSYTELANLAGFYNARSGGFDSFLWTDPDDNVVTAQSFGTGTGAATKFQLVRTFGGFVEPVFDPVGSPSIYVSGVLKTLTTDYTISNGLVTFVSAPANGAPLTWTGAYYRRMRFVPDSAEFVKFMNGLWALKSIEMESVKP